MHYFMGGCRSETYLGCATQKAEIGCNTTICSGRRRPNPSYLGKCVPPWDDQCKMKQSIVCFCNSTLCNKTSQENHVCIAWIIASIALIVLFNLIA